MNQVIIICGTTTLIYSIWYTRKSGTFIFDWYWIIVYTIEMPICRS